LKAIDIRYNKEIVGGKLEVRFFTGVERCKTKKDVIYFLSNHGCPCNAPYRYKGCVNKCNGEGCVKCWEQKVKVNE
jgi:hypothetical protein